MKSSFIKLTALLLLVLICTSLNAYNPYSYYENYRDSKTFDIPRAVYKITIESKHEARLLASYDVEPLLKISQGYLVFVPTDTEQELNRSGLKIEKISEPVARNQLFLDIRRDDRNKSRYEVFFREGNTRIYKLSTEQILSLDNLSGMAPVLTENIPLEFKEPVKQDVFNQVEMLDLESLINQIDQDSLYSYVSRMQAFYRRPADSDSNAACRDWLVSKFTDFGYDSIVIDTFGYSDRFQNVIAYKIGNRLPNTHVIVGAHRDGVANSPAADDNGSGSAAVLEMARILKDVETNVTFVFSLYDAEEIGLLGSAHYAAEASARGDSILLMLNMDMIGAQGNYYKAELYHGSDLYYPNLWIHLADSLLDLEGILAGTSQQSDHYSFQQYGYDVIFAAEYIFSTVYHSPQDSTTYMNFAYLTRMTQACMATAYRTSEMYTPFTLEFTYPSGHPENVVPGETTTLEVNVTGKTGGIPVENTGVLHYSIDNGPFSTSTMTHLGDNQYLAELPTAGCLQKIEYYITVDEITNGPIRNPESGNYKTISSQVSSIIFLDDFETDQGWSVYGYAAEGDWERGVPIGNGSGGDPQSDFDGSGSCYLTDNDYQNSDVDNGRTNLESPSFDATDGAAIIHFAFWFANHMGSYRDDEFNIFLSDDNGANWVLAEMIDPLSVEAMGGWYERSYWINDFVQSTDQVKIMFEAVDVYYPSTVEVAIDDDWVQYYFCELIGDADKSGQVDVSDAVFLINYVFVPGSPAPDPEESGNVNCDDVVDISDAVSLINYVFVPGSPAPGDC